MAPLPQGEKEEKGQAHFLLCMGLCLEQTRTGWIRKVAKPGRVFSRGPGQAPSGQHLDWGLSGSRTEKIYLCSLNPAVCDILLWKVEQTDRRAFPKEVPSVTWLGGWWGLCEPVVSDPSFG